MTPFERAQLQTKASAAELPKFIRNQHFSPQVCITLTPGRRARAASELRPMISSSVLGQGLAQDCNLGCKGVTGWSAGKG